MATVDLPRKKSPRAPSIALDDALDRVSKVYEKERLHPAPADVVAQHIGYKNANSGIALSTLASLRYYGLLDRPSEGLFCVNKQFEAFRFSPTEDIKRSFLLRFLTTPPLFAELLDRYGSELPSDGSLRYELIQRGFLPASAESVVAVLKKSVDFVGPADGSKEPSAPSGGAEPESNVPSSGSPTQSPAARPTAAGNVTLADPQEASLEERNHDRIPVRLGGGRRAWLVIPSVFYKADKIRLKAQIDLLLTQEDEDDEL